MSVVLHSISSDTPPTAEEVLAQVNALVGVLRERAPETERLRQMHPDNLRDLTNAGVFRLTLPTDVGGYEAHEDTVAEVLAQIARGCPSTGWMCTIIVATNVIPALLADEAADEIYATPDVRMTAALAPTGRAVPVDGGYRVTGQWMWNTAGVDCFMQTLPTRGAITYTSWPKAAEAPLLHHQLAKAQYDLEAAEMFTSRLSALHRGVLHRAPTIMERVQARAYIGHVATLSRACVNQLFEASSASQTLLSADIQRYFRDINVLHQHAAIQPNSGDEAYGRALAGLDPNNEIV